MTPNSMTGQEYLAAALHGYGITHVFHVPTVAVPALAAMERRGVVGVTTHGEKAAAYMADGYARARGGPGVCMAQSIGSANLAAGLRDAYMAGSPLIALTGGQWPSGRYKHVYQEIEDFPVYESLTKANWHVATTERLPDMLRQAFRTAVSGSPGPVHIELAGRQAEVLDGVIEVGDLPLAEARYASLPPFRSMAADSDIEAALAALDAASRPVIVAGGGARWSGAGEALRAFAEQLSIPVATSLNAKGVLPEDHALVAGVVGSYSAASANRAVSEADLVFFIGSHAGSQVTDNWRLPKTGTPVIQLDVEPVELGRNYPNVASLLGDAAATLERMSALADGAKRHTGWSEQVAGFVRDRRAAKADVLTSAARPIRPERLCHEINSVVPDNAVILSDTGHAGLWTAEFLMIRAEQRYIRCAGSLGWALPASLGAKCAVPERPVVCFTGDGGFYYHLGELETALRYGINAVIVVNNNRSLQQDKEPFRRGYGGPPTAQGDRMWVFEDLNLAQVAQELGCYGVRVDDPNALPKALAGAIESGRPAVVDVVTDREVFPDPPYGGRNFYAS
jgi:acetolactate synthase-1/2/3 large subunit